MRTTIRIALVLGATAASVARPGAFDGSGPPVRATMQTRDCSLGEDCSRGLTADVGASSFMHIDFEQKGAVGAKRDAPVLLRDNRDGRTLLHGY